MLAPIGLLVTVGMDTVGICANLPAWAISTCAQSNPRTITNNKEPVPSL
jgi:hypothetical protein